MFRFAEDHRAELVSLVGEAQVVMMERFEQDGLDNADRVAGKFCECGRTAEGEEAYFRRDNGRHGFYHVVCGGITQTG